MQTEQAWTNLRHYPEISLTNWEKPRETCHNGRSPGRGLKPIPPKQGVLPTQPRRPVAWKLRKAKFSYMKDWNPLVDRSRTLPCHVQYVLYCRLIDKLWGSRSGSMVPRKRRPLVKFHGNVSSYLYCSIFFPRNLTILRQQFCNML
jgi:hypothetical protein